MSNKSKSKYPDEDILAQFKSDDEFENWTNSLPEVNAEDAWNFEPDHKNCKSTTMSIQIDWHLFENYQKLATERGLSHPHPLIILALEEYLNRQETLKNFENLSNKEFTE